MLNGINRSKLSFKCVYGFVYKDIYGGRSMIVELNNVEKDLISRALVMFSLDPQELEQEEDIKNLWIKINSISHDQLPSIPEYFTLEECDNV